MLTYLFAVAYLLPCCFSLVLESARSQFPWLAGISLQGENLFFCSGALISKKWVLTPASCHVKTGDVIHLHHHDMYEFSDPQAEMLSVARVVRHPEFDLAFANNLALVELSTETSTLPLEIKNGAKESFLVAGWRKTAGGDNKLAKTVHSTLASVLPLSVCKAAYGGKIGSSHICVDDPICADIPGTPMFASNALLGMNTVDVGCGSSPAVYTNVSYFFEWITHVINSDPTKESCESLSTCVSCNSFSQPCYWCASTNLCMSEEKWLVDDSCGNYVFSARECSGGPRRLIDETGANSGEESGENSTESGEGSAESMEGSSEEVAAPTPSTDTENAHDLTASSEAGSAEASQEPSQETSGEAPTPTNSPTIPVPPPTNLPTDTENAHDLTGSAETSGETSREASVEASGEAPTEAVLTDSPTNAPTDTENAHDLTGSSEASSAEASREASAEASGETTSRSITISQPPSVSPTVASPTDTENAHDLTGSTEGSTEGSVEAPVEASAEASTETPTEAPTEAPTETAETSGEAASAETPSQVTINPQNDTENAHDLTQASEEAPASTEGSAEASTQTTASPTVATTQSPTPTNTENAGSLEASQETSGEGDENGTTPRSIVTPSQNATDTENAHDLSAESGEAAPTPGSPEGSAEAAVTTSPTTELPATTSPSPAAATEPSQESSTENGHDLGSEETGPVAPGSQESSQEPITVRFTNVSSPSPSVVTPSPSQQPDSQEGSAEVPSGEGVPSEEAASTLSPTTATQAPTPAAQTIVPPTEASQEASVESNEQSEEAPPTSQPPTPATEAPTPSTPSEASEESAEPSGVKISSGEASTEPGQPSEETSSEEGSTEAPIVPRGFTEPSDPCSLGNAGCSKCLTSSVTNSKGQHIDCVWCGSGCMAKSSLPNSNCSNAQTECRPDDASKKSCKSLGWLVAPASNLCYSPKIADKCATPMGYEAAKAWCEGAGARLCARHELADVQGYGGCNLNREFVWTADACKDGHYSQAVGPAYLSRGRCETDRLNLKAYCCGDELTPGAIGAPQTRKSCQQLGWSLSPGSPLVCAQSVFDNGCMLSANFDQAQGACHAAGARLCTVEELQNDEAKGTGCKLDDEDVWSSTICPAGVLVHKGSFSTDAEGKCTDLSLRRAVRCCSDGGDVGALSCESLKWTVYDGSCSMSKIGGSCPKAANFMDASNACMAVGARLCNVPELQNGVGARVSVSCGFDTSRVWSSTTCPGGYLTLAGNGKELPVQCKETTTPLPFRCCASSSLPVASGSRG